MKWKKIGKIFNPTNFELPNSCFEFAQSPQVLLIEDYIRVYFSTREKDNTGKYLSHIAFVDFDKKFNVLSVSKNPVIKLGSLGCFDEHGIFPFNVVKTSNKLFGYIGGWNRRVSVSVDGSIGLAISEDNGLTFQRVGDGPVLTTSINEPFLIGDPFVKVYDGLFHMWYIFGTTWKKFSEEIPPDRIYKIGHAISNDGIIWVKKEEGRQIISDSLVEHESQALPTVIKIGKKYHMFFCYRQSSDFRKNANRSYRIGYAFSEDLYNWTREDSSAGIDVTKGDWDSDMLCYPHIFEMDGDIYLIYNGNEFGRFGFGLAKLEK
jgi:predicted GH43/DUF377 family glycosyl hydrolase